MRQGSRETVFQRALTLNARTRGPLGPLSFFEGRHVAACLQSTFSVHSAVICTQQSPCGGSVCFVSSHAITAR